MQINQKVTQVLVSQGLSYSEVGELFDISRQRVHQVLTGYMSPRTRTIRLDREPRPKKDGRFKNGIKRSEEEVKADKKEYIKNWHRSNILTIDGKYVRVKKRPRPDDICEICGRIASRINYHHWDDTKPELGIWLCRPCHFMAECIDHDLHSRYLELKASIH